MKHHKNLQRPLLQSTRVVNWLASAAQNANDPSTNEESYEDKPPRGHGASTETYSKTQQEKQGLPWRALPMQVVPRPYGSAGLPWRTVRKSRTFSLHL